MARVWWFLMMVGGFGLLAMNHNEAVSNGSFWPIACLAGPLMVLVFGAGVIDPRIPVAFNPENADTPLGIKVLSGLLIVISLAVSLPLFLYYSG